MKKETRLMDLRMEIVVSDDECGRGCPFRKHPGCHLFGSLRTKNGKVFRHPHCKRLAKEKEGDLKDVMSEVQRSRELRKRMAEKYGIPEDSDVKGGDR